MLREISNFWLLSILYVTLSALNKNLIRQILRHVIKCNSNTKLLKYTSLIVFLTVAFDTPPYDPCNKYTALDQPWRATNAVGLDICDSNFNWNGWYRLLYNGMSVRMPDSCVNQSRCGTDITLWLNGSHPQIEDGIVTRGVCGNSGSDCCYFRSNPIRVKACPGNYYVYEFVRPNVCNSAYCAGTLTIF